MPIEPDDDPTDYDPDEHYPPVLRMSLYDPASGQTHFVESRLLESDLGLSPEHFASRFCIPALSSIKNRIIKCRKQRDALSAKLRAQPPPGYDTVAARKLRNK